MSVQLQRPQRGKITPAGPGLRLDDRLLARLHPDDALMLQPMLDWLAMEPRQATIGVRVLQDGRWAANLATLTSLGPGDRLALRVELREEARPGAEQALREVIEGSLQGIVVHRGRPLYANAAMARLLGFDSVEEYLRAASVTDYIHPEDRGLVAERLKARLAGEPAPPSYQFRMVRRDGAVIWVDCFASRIMWEGEPAGLASVNDATDRMRAQEALKRSERLFSTVFRSSPDGLSLTSFPDGCFIDVNDAFLAATGYAREDVVGRTSVELRTWADEAVRAAFVDEVRRSGVARDVVAAIRSRDGRVRDCSLSAELFRLEDRELLLVAMRDIGERRRQELELRQSKEAAELANRSKSEFLANMSHELRTPLNAIMGFSEIIRQQQFGPIGQTKYLEYASDIHASGEHLLKIINDILDLSKIEAGRFALHEEVVAPADVVDRCVRLIRGRAAAAGVEIEVFAPPEPPLLRAGDRALMQVLINLLSNAVKFTPEGGTVSVGLSFLANGDLELRVADTGIGMSAADIGVALTPFGQIDNVLARRHQGTGLGLPLAKSLVELHGGALSIESEPGHGVMVRTTFPAARVLPAA